MLFNTPFSLLKRTSCKAGIYAGRNPQVRNIKLAYRLHPSPIYTAVNEPDAQHAPIILMHGLFGSKQNFQSISRTIARDLKRPVYAVDLRNHGESPHEPLHTYSAMAKDVEEFMGEHNIRMPTVIGHSMGAKVAMAIALGSPMSVGALIAVDNAPVNVSLKRDFARYVQGMYKILEAKVSKHIEADEILNPYEKSLSVRQFLLTNLYRPTNSDFGALKFRIPIPILEKALGNMGDFPYRNPDEARYDGPTLFIRGTKSDYVTDEVLPVIGRFFPMFKLLDIESGHWVISEQPAAFREAIVEFLQPKD